MSGFGTLYGMIQQNLHFFGSTTILTYSSLNVSVNDPYSGILDESVSNFSKALIKTTNSIRGGGDKETFLDTF